MVQQKSSGYSKRVCFLKDVPVLFLRDIKTLAIADLHIGLEYEFWSYGITIPPQADLFFKQLESVIQTTSAEKLVIVGDVKHNIPGVSIRELKEIPRFLKKLSNLVKVEIVEGNHDGNLRDMWEDFHPASGLRIGRYGFFHGHAWPSEEVVRASVLIIAHLHPAIEFRSKFGYRSVQRVWVEGNCKRETLERRYGLKKKTKIMILPAFNPLVGSYPLNSNIPQEKTKIVEKIVDLKNSKIYMLDGTFLGSLDLLVKSL